MKPKYFLSYLIQVAIFIFSFIVQSNKIIIISSHIGFKIELEPTFLFSFIPVYCSTLWCHFVQLFIVKFNTLITIHSFNLIEILIYSFMELCSTGYKYTINKFKNINILKYILSEFTF